MRERTRLESSLGEIQGLANGLVENLELLELAEAENDADIAGDAGSSQQLITFRGRKK